MFPRPFSEPIVYFSYIESKKKDNKSGYCLFDSSLKKDQFLWFTCIYRLNQMKEKIAFQQRIRTHTNQFNKCNYLKKKYHHILSIKH